MLFNKREQLNRKVKGVYSTLHTRQGRAATRLNSSCHVGRVIEVPESGSLKETIKRLHRDSTFLPAQV